jgi:tRNA(Arg) A34 adenosine deaminase TadA
MLNDEIKMKLPEWLINRLDQLEGEYPSLEERMHLAITLSRLNVKNQTGGPFGSAVFHQETGKLVSVGVNIVLETNCSLAHAEVIAIALAQAKAGTYDLAAPSLPAHQLVTSTEPCIMCLGSIHWAGLQSVVIGARDEDVRRIGFDEGPKPMKWVKQFRSAGIEIFQDICREEALIVLDEYLKRGGVIYNPNNKAE